MGRENDSKRFDIANGAMLFTVVVWAANNIIVKRALDQIDPKAYVFGRFAIVIVPIFGWLLYRHVPLTIRREDYLLFLFTGITGYAAYNLLFTIALDHTTAFSTSILVSLGPVITMLFAGYLGSERIRTMQWVGVACSTIGVAVFVGEKLAGGKPVYGDLLSLAGAICFSAYSLATQSLVRHYGSPVVTAWSALIGLVCSLPLTLPAVVAQDWGAVNLSGWASLVYSSIMSMLVAYTIWGWAIERRGVGRTVPYMYLIPILSGVFSIWVFDESFGPVKLIGGALVLLGVAIARRSWSRPVQQPVASPPQPQPQPSLQTPQ
jgi:drug/metabolite transporter (DMT)-like permease